MPFEDITPTGIHLPKNLWMFPIEALTGDTPTIFNLDTIKSEGYAFSDFIDDDTIEVKESKNTVDRMNLTGTGPQVKDTFLMTGTTEVTIPLNAFTYQMYAFMQGYDPESSIINDADIKISDASGSGTFDGIATMVDRVETIVTQKFGLLAEVIPDDPNLGSNYFLATKISASKDEINNAITKESYSNDVMMKSNVLTDAELAKWQEFMPKIKKSIPFYRFSVKAAGV